MRYINPRFAYLLYLLTYLIECTLFVVVVNIGPGATLCIGH